MAYFGGGGVVGRISSSLQAYIDCFSSNAFVKSWPRGGGIWDQDPMLVRNFRIIKSYEIKWKEAQLEAERAKQGGASGLSSTLDEYIKSLEE